MFSRALGLQGDGLGRYARDESSTGGRRPNRTLAWRNDGTLRCLKRCCTVYRAGGPVLRTGLLVASLTFTFAVAAAADTQAPQLQSVTVDTNNAKILILTFDEDLATPNAQELSDLRFVFAIQGLYWHGVPVRNVSPDVAVSGRTVRLILNLAAAPGRKLTVTYIASGSGAHLQDSSGNKVASFTTTVTRPIAGSVPPVLTAAYVAGTALTLIFDQELDAGSAPAGRRFYVICRSATCGSISGTGTATLSGKKVTVTLASAVPAGESHYYAYYKKGDDPNPLRGASSGPKVEDILAGFFTRRFDATAPKLVEGSVAGTSVTLYYDKALDTDSKPATGDFTVTVASSARTVSDVSMSETAVTLTLSSAVSTGQPVTVTYRAGTNPIRDLGGINAANLTNKGMTNDGSTDPGKPTLAATSPAVVDGTVLTLTYNQPFDPTNVPSREAFTVLGPWWPVTGVAVRGRKVELSLGQSVFPCTAAFAVSYAKPSANALRNVWGTQADGFTEQSVTNAQASACDSSWLQGTAVGSVILTARRPFATDGQPQREWFTVTTSEGPLTVTEAAFSSDDPQELKLSLSRDIAPDETVTVSYTRPPQSRGLWDVDGKQLGDIRNREVVNEAPPVINEQAEHYDDFTGTRHAPRGMLVWKIFEDFFSDPDGGELTYTASVPADQSQLVETLVPKFVSRVNGHPDGLHFLFFEADADDDWKAVTPALADPLVITATLTATDPDGLSASVKGDFRVDWESHPALLSAVASSEAIELTFDQAVEGTPGPGAGQFRVNVVNGDGSGGTLVVSRVSVSGAVVTLHLASALENRQAVTLDYTHDAASPLQRAAGGGDATPDFTGQAVSVGIAPSAPSATGVSVVSSAGADKTYGADDTIHVRVTFSEAVDVTGTPRLKIDMDPAHWGEKWAAYTSGSGTTSLTFAHTVVEPNLSTQGIAVLANTLELNNGTIRASGADANLAHAGLAHDANHKVDWRIEPDDGAVGGPDGNSGASEPPAVSAVAVVSDPGADNTYVIGDTIRVQVTFTERVTVTGSPELKIDMDPAAWGEKRAAYASGSGTTNLTFAHPVVEPNYSPQGIAVLADSLALNGGTIRSAGGTDAALGHTGLAHDSGHKVDWRPTISVADARAKEGAGATVDFEVSLSRAFTGTGHSVTVDYATSNGSAAAGSDYTAASGTLTFASGERAKTVNVSVLDDAHDEGNETFTLRLSNASGASLTDGEATGTIENADLMPAALLARFGRATAEQVVKQVEERMAAPRDGGFRARLAGREYQPGMEEDFARGFLSSFAPMNTGAAAGSHLAGAFGADTSGTGGMSALGGATDVTGAQQPGAMGGGGLFGALALGGDPLSSSGFELNRASHDGKLSVWSRSSRSYFTGMEEALSLNGDVRTTMFGADWARGPLTVGLSVGHTRGLGGYAGASGGAMTTAMTGFYPWVGYHLNDRVSVWAVTGYGKGALTLTPDGAGELETGMSMAMTAVGTRGDLLGSRATGGFGLAFKADALWVGATTELLNSPTGRLNASEAGATRVRTALEGSRGFTLGGGRLSLRPTVELGLRRDGGDAETGAGLDLGGGVAVADAEMGLSLDVRVRTLLAHQAEGFAERGLSVSFGWDPTPSSPLGLSARLAPSWGGSAMGGAEALWNGQMAYGPGSPGAFGSGAQLNAEAGYGLPVGARFVGTPRVGLRRSAYGREYRAGWALGVLDTSVLHFDLGLEAQRREAPTHGGASNGLLARATVSW